MPAVQSGHGFTIARTFGSTIGKPLLLMYSAPSGCPWQYFPTVSLTIISSPRPQRAKSLERHTPNGYPICAWVVCPENEEPIPIWQRGTLASGPQSSTDAIGTSPAIWLAVAPRLVTTLSFCAQLAPMSIEKSGFCSARTLAVSSQPLLVSAPALMFWRVKPVDGTRFTLNTTSWDLES